VAAAVAACSCSRRGAGERGWMGRASAPWRCGAAIAVPNLAGAGGWGGRRSLALRWTSGSSGGGGGTGSIRFRPRGAKSSTRAGREASRGGEEALGRWNLDGVGQPRGNSSEWLGARLNALEGEEGGNERERKDLGWAL
jgi:hypothetical protein